MTDPEKMLQEAMRLPVAPSRSCMNCKNLVDDKAHLTALLRFRCAAHGFHACSDCNADADCTLWEQGEGVTINEVNAYGSWKEPVIPPQRSAPSAPSNRSMFDIILVALITSILTALLLHFL